METGHPSTRVVETGLKRSFSRCFEFLHVNVVAIADATTHAQRGNGSYRHAMLLTVVIACAGMISCSIAAQPLLINLYVDIFSRTNAPPPLYVLIFWYIIDRTEVRYSHVAHVV